MALEKLGEALTGVIKKITLASLVDEKLVKEVVRDIQRALLQADVNVKLVMALSKTIEERALREKPRAGLSKKEHAATIVYEELVRLLGRKQEFVPKKSKIMLVGLQGSGKTTTAVKLAKFYMKRGLRPFVIIADTFRPAAYEQAVQLAEPLNIKVYGEPANKDSTAIARKGLEEAGKSEVIILDTAGRHKSEAELFEEMKQIFRIYQPDEKLLVIDSSIGQQAGAQARAFHEAIGITGVILTKVDGSAKGGGALSAVAETASPIRFIGTGEKVDNIELFDAERFISRLLGMGDLAALLEKAEETMDEDAAEKFLKGEFTLFDLQGQIAAIRKLGPLSSVLKMIPGLGAAMPKETSEVTETKLKKFLVILDSMCKREKSDPKILDSSRIKRIARGSGTAVEEVKELINYHATMKKALKGFKRGFGRGYLAKMMHLRRGGCFKNRGTSLRICAYK